MKAKKILAGIIALGMSCSLTYEIIPHAETLEYKISDLVGLINYVLDGTLKIDKSRMDINSDGEINLADIIWMKSVILGDSDVNAKIYDVQKLNEDASKLYSYAQRIAYTAEIEGQAVKDGIYSYDKRNSYISNDSEENFYQKISDMAQENNISKWAFIIEDYKINGVVTMSDDLFASGAYPNMIPQKYNVPYNEIGQSDISVLRYTCDDEYCMVTDLRKFISLNPKQASLPDYPLEMILKLRNDCAKSIYNNLQTLAREYETKGIKLDEWYNDESSCDFVDEYNKRYGTPLIKWRAMIENNMVKGVVTKYENDAYCGTYPNIIPQKYNIPYGKSNPSENPDFIITMSYACGDEYSISADLSRYVSSDPEQASLPDYPLETLLKLRNDCAKRIYSNLQTLAQEYETKGIKLDDWYDDESSCDFVDDYNKRYETPLIKWRAMIENNVVKGVATKYWNDAYCGTYPYIIPQKYNIPYGESNPSENPDFIITMRYACGDQYSMSADLSSYVSSDSEQASLPDYSIETLLNLRNDCAKRIYSNLQTLAQEYETKGIKLDDWYNDENSCDFVNEYNNRYGTPLIKWRAIIENNVVKGVVTKYGNDAYCGTYPNIIPQKYNIPYGKNNQSENPDFIITMRYACDDQYSMSADLSSYVSSDPEQASLPDYCIETLLKQRNDSAKRIYSNLQTLAQEYETKGIKLDELYNNESSCDFVDEYNNRYGTPLIKWRAIIENNVVKGVVTKNWNDAYCGTYPNIIPQKYNIPYGNNNQSENPDFIITMRYACDDQYCISADLSSYASSNPEQALFTD